MINICIEIFFARILDVSLNTIRTFFTLKGKILPSTIISFFEILIWFIVECNKSVIKKVLINIKKIDYNAHISISDIHSITQNKKVTSF